MKKFLLLALTITLFSCDLDSGEDQPSFSLEIMSIESVDAPDEFTFGEAHEITVNYTRPNDCYQFNDFIFQPSESTRTVAVVDTVYENISCSQALVNASVSFDFTVTSMETYVFQFYQGEDNNGEDQYLIVEIPVVE